jgi:hypothetical protein
MSIQSGFDNCMNLVQNDVIRGNATLRISPSAIVRVGRRRINAKNQKNDSRLLKFSLTSFSWAIHRRIQVTLMGVAVPWPQGLRCMGVTNAKNADPFLTI